MIIKQNQKYIYIVIYNCVCYMTYKKHINK